MVEAVRGLGEMNILYITQYFPPEIGATQSRSYEMAKNLIKLGHRVTIMTEVPNHPSGVISPAYRGRFRVRETYDGIPVIRSWVDAHPEKTFNTRMRFYLSFLATTIINSLFLGPGRFDVVYATSPPLFVGLAGLVIARMRRAFFFFEVRDLWPESAVDLGQLGNPRNISRAHTIADLCYRRARGIVAVTVGILERLQQKGISQEKLFLIKNGTNPDCFRYIRDLELEKKLGWAEKFVVLYAGIHGIAQGLEKIIDAAGLLSDEPSIHFAFIGEGPRKKELIKYANMKGVTNLQFLPEIPSDEVPKYISLASLCLVPLKKIELFKGALPCKIFDSWGCGKPVLLSVEGEARRVVEEAKGGICVEPENSVEIANAVRIVFSNQSIGCEMGENGRRYIFEKGYIREAQAKELIRAFEKTLKGNTLPSP